MNNKKFIEINKDHNYGEEQKVWHTGREILSTDRIVHIYIVETERKSICIEYRGRHNRIHSLHESFDTEGECLNRFWELKRMLCEYEEEV